MFKELLLHISEESLTMINRAVIVPHDQIEEVDLNSSNLESAIDISAIQTNKEVEQRRPIKKTSKLGRNERVVIKKGALQKELKWKVAEVMVNSEGWELV